MQGERNRPIVFICHSLGGLVVKQALVTAKLNDKYADVVSATSGIAFFATPHRGGNGATVAELGSRALGLFSGQPPSTLLPVLRKRSIFSESLSTNFQTISKDYRVVSFFEERTMGLKIRKMMIRTRVTQMVRRDTGLSLCLILTSPSTSSNESRQSCSRTLTSEKRFWGLAPIIRAFASLKISKTTDSCRPENHYWT
jgi:hypothetical protein